MTNLLMDAQAAASEPEFNWTQSDLDAALAVLAEGQNPPQETLILTDEEVVALDGLHHSQIAPTPWLDAQTFDRDALGGIALRGLMARKMVAVAAMQDTEGTETGDLRLTATRDITGIMMLRRTAQTIFRLERTTNTGPRWVFAYRHEGRGVLLEDIDANGLHVFGVTDLAGATDFIVGIANPLDAAGSAGESASFSGAEFEALTEVPAAFEGAEAASVIVRYNHGEDDVTNMVVYAGPDTIGTLVPGDDEFVARPITAEELTRLIHQLVDGDEID